MKYEQNLIKSALIKGQNISFSYKPEKPKKADNSSDPDPISINDAQYLGTRSDTIYYLTKGSSGMSSTPLALISTFAFIDTYLEMKADRTRKTFLDEYDTDRVIEKTTFEYNALGQLSRSLSSNGTERFFYYYEQGSDTKAKPVDMDDLLGKLTLKDGTSITEAAALRCNGTPLKNDPLPSIRYERTNGKSATGTLSLYGFAKCTTKSNGVPAPDTILSIENVLLDTSTSPPKATALPLAGRLLVSLTQFDRNTTSNKTSRTTTAARTVTSWQDTDTVRETTQVTDKVVYDSTKKQASLTSKLTNSSGSRLISSSISSSYSSRTLRQAIVDSEGIIKRFYRRSYDCLGRLLEESLHATDDKDIGQEPASTLASTKIAYTQTDSGTRITISPSEGKARQILQDGLQRTIETKVNVSRYIYCPLIRTDYTIEGSPVTVEEFNYFPGGRCRSLSGPKIVHRRNDTYRTANSYDSESMSGGDESTRLRVDYQNDEPCLIETTAFLADSDGNLVHARMTALPQLAGEQAFVSGRVDTFDIYGRISHAVETLANDKGVGYQRHWSFDYDERNRCTAIGAPDGTSVRYTYEGESPRPNKALIGSRDDAEKDMTILGTISENSDKTTISHGNNVATWTLTDTKTISPDGNKISVEISDDALSSNLYLEKASKEKNTLCTSKYEPAKRTATSICTKSAIQKSILYSLRHPTTMGTVATDYAIDDAEQRVSTRLREILSYRGPTGAALLPSGILVRRSGHPLSRHLDVYRNRLHYRYTLDGRYRVGHLRMTDGDTGARVDVHHAYDGADREIERTYRLRKSQDDPSNDIVVRHVMTYIGALLRKKQVFRGRDTNPARSDTYEYDALTDRLTEWKTSGDSVKDRDGNTLSGQAFKYNPDGSIASAVSTFADGTSESRTYSYDKNSNRRTKISLKDKNGNLSDLLFLYDSNGNRINNERKESLSFNHAQQLLNVKDKDGQLVSSYVYDDNNRLVRQWDEKNKCARTLIYANDVLCGEILADSDGKVTQRIAYDEEAGLVIDMGDDPGAHRVYQFMDPIGGGLDSHELKNGSITSQIVAFTPYGEAPGDSLQTLPACSGYNGQRFDPVTGDYHPGNGYRCYSPSEMIFMQPDSYTWQVVLDVYGYCNGNPIKYHDPSGHIMVNRRYAAEQLATLDKYIQQLTPPEPAPLTTWQWVSLVSMAVLTLFTVGAGLGMALAEAGALAAAAAGATSMVGTSSVTVGLAVAGSVASSAVSGAVAGASMAASMAAVAAAAAIPLATVGVMTASASLLLTTLSQVAAVGSAIAISAGSTGLAHEMGEWSEGLGMMDMASGLLFAGAIMGGISALSSVAQIRELALRVRSARLRLNKASFTALEDTFYDLCAPLAASARSSGRTRPIPKLPSRYGIQGDESTDVMKWSGIPTNPDAITVRDDVPGILVYTDRYATKASMNQYKESLDTFNRAANYINLSDYNYKTGPMDVRVTATLKNANDIMNDIVKARTQISPSESAYKAHTEKFYKLGHANNATKNLTVGSPADIVRTQLTNETEFTTFISNFQNNSGRTVGGVTISPLDARDMDILQHIDTKNMMNVVQNASASTQIIDPDIFTPIARSADPAAALTSSALLSGDPHQMLKSLDQEAVFRHSVIAADGFQALKFASTATPLFNALKASSNTSAATEILKPQYASLVTSLRNRGMGDIPLNSIIDAADYIRSVIQRSSNPGSDLPTFLNTHFQIKAAMLQQTTDTARLAAAQLLDPTLNSPAALQNYLKNSLCVDRAIASISDEAEVMRCVKNFMGQSGSKLPNQTSLFDQLRVGLTLADAIAHPTNATSLLLREFATGNPLKSGNAIVGAISASKNRWDAVLVLAANNRNPDALRQSFKNAGLDATPAFDTIVRNAPQASPLATELHAFSINPSGIPGSTVRQAILNAPDVSAAALGAMQYSKNANAFLIDICPDVLRTNPGAHIKALADAIQASTDSAGATTGALLNVRFPGNINAKLGSGTINFDESLREAIFESIFMQSNLNPGKALTSILKLARDPGAALDFAVASVKFDIQSQLDVHHNPRPNMATQLYNLNKSLDDSIELLKAITPIDMNNARTWLVKKMDYLGGSSMLTSAEKADINLIKNNLKGAALSLPQERLTIMVHGLPAGTMFQGVQLQNPVAVIQDLSLQRYKALTAAELVRAVENMHGPITADCIDLHVCYSGAVTQANDTFAGMVSRETGLPVKGYMDELTVTFNMNYIANNTAARNATNPIPITQKTEFSDTLKTGRYYKITKDHISFSVEKNQWVFEPYRPEWYEPVPGSNNLLSRKAVMQSNKLNLYKFNKSNYTF